MIERRWLLTAAWAGAAAAAVGRAAIAQEARDSVPETRPASQAAPSSLLRGPHYTVGPDVVCYDYLNTYNVSSDFGQFVATSDTRLRRLALEIAAIAALKQVEETKAFSDAAMAAGKGVYAGAKNLISDPVATLSTIPDGIGAIFGRATEQVRRSGRSKYEDNAAKEILAVSSFKRDNAAKLGVDVYSSNEVLQRELNRVAWAAAAGNLSLSALSLATGAVALQVASHVRLIEQARDLVQATPPSELSRRNRDALRRIGVPDAGVNQFLQNKWLSPRHQTVIVASLTALGNIPGRADFVTYANQASNEDEAFLFQQTAELLAGYSASVAPVRQIVMSNNLPLALLDRRGPVLLVPIDRLLWTDANAAIAANLATRQQPVRAVWITGQASALARSGLRHLGFELTEQCGRQIPLLD